MPKANCKYWDKCYQRNEAHLQKYNHPPKGELQKDTETKNMAPKRKLEADQPNNSDSSSSNNSSMEDNHEDNNGKPPQENEKYETEDLREEAINNISGKNYMEILEKRIRLSVEKEYENLCSSNEFIRHKFLVEMPPDFYEFWKFVNSLKKDTTNMSLIEYLDKQFQLQLVGPFEFLAGRFHKAKICEPGDYLRHWRFYYDPPEFQTVFVRRGTGVHYGYWRDTPQDKEDLLVARNDAATGYEFEFIAGNIFDAFLYYLEKDFVGSPFTAAAVAATKRALAKHIQDNTLEYKKLDTLSKARNRNVVTKTFHRAGIVVPFERRSQQGYRPLMASDAELKKILKPLERKAESGGNEDDATNNDIKKAVLEKLQPIVNAANIAMDECDFGTTLELGIDLFCSGHKELHMVASSLLVPGYSMLMRPQFIAIAKAHMDVRRRNFNLSIFDVINSTNE